MTDHRNARLNEQFKREISNILSQKVRDPRVGTVNVTGVRVTPDLWLARADATGTEIWSTILGANGFEYGYWVEQSGDGGFIVAGYTSSFGAGGHDVWLVKTDAMGETVALDD